MRASWRRACCKGGKLWKPNKYKLYDSRELVSKPTATGIFAGRRTASTTARTSMSIP
jgi:hypothetical protein